MSAPLTPGEFVERYVVEDLLGQGGMASVYRVRHAQLHSLFALKVLTLRSPELDERFLSEGRVQATLRHPNIVTVHDVIDAGPHPALLMEFIRGVALDELLDIYRPTTEETVEVFRAIVHAIGFAHTRGHVHRDLKPANVMLEWTPHGVVPRVADFGLAKTGFGGRSTRTGMMMGTPAYMAPEQVQDASRVDHRADLYPLGAILYEMLSGRPPFITEDIISIMRERAIGAPAIRELNPDAPPRLAALAEALMEEEPDDRPADCLEILRTLLSTSVEASDLTRPLPAIGGRLFETVAEMIEDKDPHDDPVASAPTFYPTEDVIESPAPAPAPSTPTPAPAPSLSPPSAELPPEAPPARRSPLLVLAMVAVLLIGLVGVGFLAVGGAAGVAAMTMTRGGPVDVPEPTLVRDPAPEPAGDTKTKTKTKTKSKAKAKAKTTSEPEPKTTSAPSPSPAQPAPAATGVVVVEGDASTVFLRKSGRDHQPGRLAPGTYVIVAGFGGAPFEGPSVEVRAGGRHVVRCDSRASLCRVQP